MLLRPGLGMLRPIALGLHIGHAVRHEHAQYLGQRHLAQICCDQQVDQIVRVRQMTRRPLLHGHGTVQAERLDLPTGRSDALRVGVQAVNDVAVSGAQRGRQPAVVARRRWTINPPWIPVASSMRCARPQRPPRQSRPCRKQPSALSRRSRFAWFNTPEIGSHDPKNRATSYWRIPLILPWMILLVPQSIGNGTVVSSFRPRIATPSDTTPSDRPKPWR